MKIWPFRPKKNPESPPSESSGLRQQLEDIMTYINTSEHQQLFANGVIHGAPSQDLRRFDRWLDQRLRAAKKQPFAEVVVLTPEIAQGLIARNPENRTLRADQIAKIASDIVMERWEFNGETIIVSEEGYLNDGQHRCLAVIRAGKPVKVVMTFGVSRDSRTTVDDGRARTVSDYLSMEGGNKNTAATAAVAHQILEIKRNQRLMNGTTSISKQEILAKCRYDEDIARSVEFVTHRKKARKIATLTTLAIAHYLLAEKNRSKADEFISTMIEGEGLSAGDGRFVCREKLLSRDLRLTKNEQLKTIIAGWNNWRADRKVRTIVHSMKRGEALPEVSA